MIVTPCIPILGENSTNVGTDKAAALLKTPASQMEFNPIAPLSEKINLLKQAVIMSALVAVAVDGAFLKLV